MDIVLKRWRQDLLPRGDQAQATAKRVALESARDQTSNGTWKDIDYTKDNRAQWDAARHVRRVRDLAGALDVLAGDEKAQVLQALQRAIDYWVKSKHRCSNWWWNDIGVPIPLGEASLLMGDRLDDERRKAVCAVLYHKGWASMTGQNLVWMSRVRLLRALLQQDGKAVQEAFARVWKEIFRAPAGKEGVQADSSFHQHGAVLYAGGYGAGFTTDNASLIACTHGTAYAIPAEKEQIYSSYVLDGQQWMIRGAYWDYGAIGRQITRPGQQARSLIPALEKLAALSLPRQAEFKAFLARMKEEPEARPLSGNRHFWRSDYMVHHRPAFMASVRMHSTRMRNTDMICNDEGRQSQYLADGLTYIFRRGDEYRDIFPCWNWKQLPGITSDLGKGLVGENARPGPTSFVGGASDGAYGCAAMDFKRGELSARKSWFFFDRGFLALGAGIAGGRGDEVATTLDQRLLNGPVSASTQDGALQLGDARSLPNASWVWHDGVAYVLDQPGTFRFSATKRTQNWKTIGARDQEETQEVFMLWLSHGPKPADASYAYHVLPGLASQEIGAWMEQKPQVLANAKDVQAAYEPNARLRMAVFWKAGAVAQGGLVFGADQPSVVILRQEGGTLHVTAANPENKPLSVKVTVQGKYSGEGARQSGPATEIILDLPKGLQGGSSVTKSLTMEK